MTQYLDARGKQCPLPLMLAKKALEKLNVGDVLEVSVDNEIAMENLEKMAVQKALGYKTEVIGQEHYIVKLQLQGSTNEMQTKENEPQLTQSETYPAEDKTSRTHGEMVVVLSSNKMGEGEAELGQLLLKGFIYSLTGLEQLPTTVIMYNSGAKLAIASSEVISDLQLLEQKGVKIVTCGTCLDYYKIADQLAVGSVTNMYDIVETLASASKIIKP